MRIKVKQLGCLYCLNNSPEGAFVMETNLCHRFRVCGDCGVRLNAVLECVDAATYIAPNTLLHYLCQHGIFLLVVKNETEGTEAETSDRH